MDNSAEETCKITEREWEKLKETAQTQGFREGVLSAQESSFQEYFDKGYTVGFHNGKELGILKVSKTLEIDLNDSTSLDLSTTNLNSMKPALGLCQICNNDELLSKSIPEIIDEQQKVMENIADTVK